MLARNPSSRPARVLVVFVAFSAASACASAVGPDGSGDARTDARVMDATSADTPSTTDAQATQDVAVTAMCDRAADCARLPTPQSVSWCRPGAAESSSWSCLDHRCTWECGIGGDTCVRMPDGCIDCERSPSLMECPGQRCASDLPAMPGSIEEAICSRAFHLEIASCFSRWVLLRDGTLCSLHGLPTGALRSVLACGPCQTTLPY